MKKLLIISCCLAIVLWFTRISGAEDEYTYSSDSATSGRWRGQLMSLAEPFKEPQRIELSLTILDGRVSGSFRIDRDKETGEVQGNTINDSIYVELKSDVANNLYKLSGHCYTMLYYENPSDSSSRKIITGKWQVIIGTIEAPNTDFPKAEITLASESKW